MKMTIIYGYTLSPFGKTFMAYTPIGLCMLNFVKEGTESVHEALLRKQWQGNDFISDDEEIKKRAKDIFCPLKKGKYPPMHIGGTIFQQKVWFALLEIPFGTTVSYSDIARKIEKPKAVRAVATAVGKNDISFVIPCHRVVHSDGKDEGYRWGTDIKRKILEWEKNIKSVI